MILLVDSEGPDQTAQMRRLIWAFTVCICPKKCFIATDKKLLMENGYKTYFVHYYKHTAKVEIHLKICTDWSRSSVGQWQIRLYKLFIVQD